MITNFTATAAFDGTHVVLSWQALNFNEGTLFEVFRSIDGGVAFDSCATNPSGQCLTATFTLPGGYTLLDYGVKNNFLYSYRIRDSEGGGYWYMAAAFSGSLIKPAAPNPVGVPSFTLSDLWTDGTTAKVMMNLALTGTPPHATLWAHNYTVSYYRDGYPTVQTLTAALRGTGMIALGQDPLPALVPFWNYHIKIRGNGMSANTPYSAERHVRIMPAPNLYHAAVLAGTSISLQWWAADWAAGAEYDILYQRVSPDPPGNVVVVNAGTARVWNLSGLAEQSVYEVRVRARDLWGNASPASLGIALQTGTASPTDVTDIPHALELRVSPVPFNPGGVPARVQFALPSTEQTELAIFDVRGSRVRSILHGPGTAGRHVTLWDGRDERGRTVAGGIYLARLRAGGKVLTQKFVVAK